MKDYSDKTIDLVFDFIKYVNEESDDGVTVEQVYAMLDAFDPNLKDEIIMRAIMGDHKRQIKIRANGKQTGYKINAIKELRSYFGLTLKEAKEYADSAEHKLTHIPYDIGLKERIEFMKKLESFGYTVI